MSRFAGSYIDDEEEPAPVPEYRPAAHPDVVFRAHSTGGRHSIIPLGGEDYWVQGLWMAQSGNFMSLVKDRLFRVSELTTFLPTPELVFRFDITHPALS